MSASSASGGPRGGRFLAIGDCLVAMAPAGDGLFRMGFAGDTFNTAWYARRLLSADWSVGYATAAAMTPS